MSTLSVAGQWKEVQDIYINDHGTWKLVAKAFLLQGGVWKEVTDIVRLAYTSFSTDAAYPLPSPYSGEYGAFEVQNGLIEFSVSGGSLRATSIANSAEGPIFRDTVPRNPYATNRTYGIRAKVKAAWLYVGQGASGALSTYLLGGTTNLSNESIPLDNGGATPRNLVNIRHPRRAFNIVEIEAGRFCLITTNSSSFSSTFQLGIYNRNNSALEAEDVEVFQLKSGAFAGGEYALATSYLPGVRAQADLFTHNKNLLLQFTVTSIGNSGCVDIALRKTDEQNKLIVRIFPDGSAQMLQVIDGEESILISLNSGAFINGRMANISCDASRVILNASPLSGWHGQTSSAIIGLNATQGQLERLDPGWSISEIIAWPYDVSSNLSFFGGQEAIDDTLPIVPDLYPAFQSAEIDAPLYVDTGVGRYILIGSRGEGVTPGRLGIINVDSNEVQVLDGITSRVIAPRPPLFHSNGKLYLQGNPLREVDLAEATITSRGSMSTRDNYTLRESSDGKIWMGGAPQLGLAFYDPSTQHITNCGNPWAGYNTGEGYIYTLEVDTSGNYVYCGLGKIPWRLAVWDVVNEQWLYPFGGNGDDTPNNLIGGEIDNATSSVARNAAGDCFYYKADTHQWYGLAGGIATPTTAPAIQPEEITNNVLMNLSAFGVETNWSKLFPTSDGISITKYRPTGSSEPYIEAEAQVTVYDVPLRRTYPLSDGRLLLVPEAYYPLAILDPESETLTPLAPTGSSNYGVIEVNGKIYLSGYSNSFQEYDPTQMWTLDKVVQGTGNASTNPASFGGFAKYNRLIDTFNNKIYFGSQWERDNTGSVIGEFDPATRTKRNLRSGLEDWNVRGFCASGGRLVHSIAHRLSSQDAKLWIINPDTMTKESEFTPFPGLKSAAHLVSVAAGEVVGCVKDKAFRIRISDGTILWTATLPGTHSTLIPSYDANLAVGGDGNIYLWIGSRLWRLNPSDGTTTKTGLVTVEQGWLSFATNGDLWLAGSHAPRRIRADQLY